MNSRKIWLDYLRIIAIVGVVLVHTSVTVFKGVELSNLNWWLANALNTASRFCVPLFVMISGYLVLSKDMPIEDFYRKKSIRIIPPLLFWSFFYVAVELYLNNAFNFTSLFTLTAKGLLLEGNTAPHLWYLSMFACLMVIAPFLNKFVLGIKLNEKDIWYLFLLFAIFATLIQASTLFKFFNGIGVGWFKQFKEFAGYFLLGYFIGNKLLKINIKIYKLIIFIVIIITLSMYANFILIFELNTKVDWLVLMNTGIFNFLITCTIFYTFFCIKDKLIDFKFIKPLSNASFGVYLIHPFIMVLIKKLEVFNILQSGFHFVAYIVSVLICSFVSIAILKKIPWFNNVT